MPFHFCATAILLLVLLFGDGTAYCPSNGNTHAIYITSNAGDNIWAFDTEGRFIGNVLNKETFPIRVEKLRDMKFGPGNYLYIASARGKFSRIFAVSGNGILNGTLGKNCTRDYLFTVAEQNETNPMLDHPYAIAFNPEDDSLYVSNQNSVTVLRYTRVDVGDSKYPLWEPAENVEFALTNFSLATGVPKKAGLFASPWSNKYALLSVRGLAISPPLPRSLVEQAAPAGLFATGSGLLVRYLVVCDLALNKLLVFYADTGAFVFSTTVPSPVQVVFPSRYFRPIESPASHFEVPHVYVTSKEDGMTYLVPLVGRSPTMAVGDFSTPHHQTPSYPITSPVFGHAASGIYENPSHDLLLIADRVGRSVMSYVSPFRSGLTSSDGPSPFLGYFIKVLPDMPEFVLTTAVEQQSAIPFCYELTGEGTFRYVALCTAAYMWSTVLVVISVLLTVICVTSLCGRCFRRLKGACGNYFRSLDTMGAEDVELLQREVPSGYGTGS